MRREVTAVDRVGARRVRPGRAAPAPTRGRRARVGLRCIARQLQQVGQHRLLAGTATGARLALGEPDGRGLQRQQAGPDPERRLEERQQGRQHPGPERRAQLDRHERLGPVGLARADGRGAGRLRHDRGQREDEHRARGLRRGGGRAEHVRPDPWWPAASTRSTTAATRAPLRRTPTAAGTRPRWALRRQGHDDAALGLQDVHLLRPALLRVRRGLLPALHLRGRALLLPGAAPVLLVPRRPGGAVMRGRGSPTSRPRTAATASRRRAARGRSSTRRCPRPRGPSSDAPGPARAGDRRRHHLLPVLEHVLPAGGERRPGDLRRRDGSRRRRVRPLAARGLPGGPAQHDVLRGPGRVLRALPVDRRQGAVRAGRPAATAAAATAPRRPRRAGPCRGDRTAAAAPASARSPSRSSCPRRPCSWCAWRAT